MTVVPAEAVPADRYRTRARRLRAAYRSDPVRLQQALRDLANVRGREGADVAQATSERPAAPVVDWSRSAVIGPRAGEARRFADLVALNLSDPVLPYRVRTKLLREAARRGIGRFEANLIIAAVQHQLGHLPVQNIGHLPGRRTRWPRVSATVVTFLLVQTAIVLAAWWVMS